MTRIVLISDTHNRHGELVVPDGDILIHAGDFSLTGYRPEIESFNTWLGTLPHRHKIVVAGNHDRGLEENPGSYEPLISNAVYLLDSSVICDGYKIYGAPWTLPCGNWAFMMKQTEIAAKWDLIPPDTDVLVTHGPPMGYGDLLYSSNRTGDWALLTAIEKVRPALHVCGHIHEDYGIRNIGGHTITVNAAICDLEYKATHEPIVIDFPAGA